MKKIVTKLVTVMLALSLVFSVLALSGCGDRKLDDVEKSIVGKWQDSRFDTTVTTFFDEDGTYRSTEGSTPVEFKHKGSGNDAERGHYEIIVIGADHSKFALFDTDKNTLYAINTSKNTVRSDMYLTRK